MMTKDIKSLLLAILLSTVVLIGWQYFYESPRKEKIEQAQSLVQQKKLEARGEELEKAKLAIAPEAVSPADVAGRVSINTDKLKGSIFLKGLRFDDLQFKSYRQTLDANSPLVQLFHPSGLEAYFAEFGWIKDATDQTLTAPDKNSIWQCDQAELTENKPINCVWQNSQNIHYIIKIAVDKDYLFTISQSVENKSNANIALSYWKNL